jgi:hypothetical protein
MKNLWVYGLLLLAASLTSCDKNEAAKPAENPITTLLSEQSQALKLVKLRENSFRELGVVFSSSVAGKLTQLGSKLPDAGIYLVTVWDFDSGQVLLQKNGGARDTRPTNPYRYGRNDAGSQQEIPYQHQQQVAPAPPGVVHHSL